jgi:hypothetical protein
MGGTLQRRPSSSASHLQFPERQLYEAGPQGGSTGVVVDVGANLGVYTLMTRTVTPAPDHRI